jgi:hypothetical protein
LLLTTFGSLQAIRDATAEQIGALPGFSAKSGQRILDALRASDAVAPVPATSATTNAEPEQPADQRAVHDDSAEIPGPAADSDSP